jgi:rubrerythrin
MADLSEKVIDFFTNAKVNMRTLHEVLSEFLAVEVGGQKLYERALELVTDTEVRSKFREYHRQTVRHQKTLIDVIRKLNGNPQMPSAKAKVAAAKAQALLKTMGRSGLSKDEAQLNAIENIVLAETKDHADWELLGKIVRQTTDSHLREVLRPAVHTVEQEEDEHLNWTRKKLGELQMASLVQQDKASSKLISLENGGSKRSKRKQLRASKGPQTAAVKSPPKPAAPAKERKRTHR